MTGYLLDTNVISEVRSPKPHGAVLEWIAALRPQEIFVPSIALFELQAGVELTRRQDPGKAQEIERWIDALCRLDNILPLDWQCFRLCAKLIDGLTVATRNIRDYRHFEVPVLNPFSTRR
jgi:predicted nucleic acid-binding protein